MGIDSIQRRQELNSCGAGKGADRYGWIINYMSPLKKNAVKTHKLLCALVVGAAALADV